MHAAWPALAPKEPGKHGASTAEPTEHAVPALHVMQSLTFVITVRLVSWRVPPGHGSGAADPSTQRYPLVQAWHAVWPREPVNVPGAHKSHVPWPGEEAKLPGKQTRHTLELTLPGIGLALPTSHAMHELVSEAPGFGL